MIIPVGDALLEVLLNFVQALIFSTLMLMFTIIAVESHTSDHEEHRADIPEGGIGPPTPLPAEPGPLTQVHQHRQPATEHNGGATTWNSDPRRRPRGPRRHRPRHRHRHPDRPRGHRDRPQPRRAPQIRAQFILGAAFAEGLGVLAIVVAILALVL